MTFTRSLASAGIAALLGVVLAPGAAHAASLSIADSTGDTWENVYDPETETSSDVAAGSQVNVDMTGTVVRHTARSIVLTTTYVDLDTEQAVFGLVQQLRFNRGADVWASVGTESRQQGTRHLLNMETGRPIPCKGYTHAIDYTANTVRLTLPRTCVAKPTWVKVNGFSMGIATEEGGEHHYRDAARTAGAGDGGWSRRVARG